MTAPPLVFPAVTRHTATVLFVHGLGDTGHGWASAVENWRRRQRLDHVKFILPHAPMIRVTAGGGQMMPGWYDIAVLDGGIDSLRRSEDEAGVLRSQAYFHGLIKKEIDAGIPSERIVLGGFSQGGAMSTFCGLTAPYKLAGIIAMSAYLVLSLKFAELVPKPEFNKETPVLMFHGDADQVVNPMMGKMSYDFLKEKGYNVTRKVYPGMGHSACLEELDEIEAFVTSRIPQIQEQESAGKSEL